MGDWLEMYTRVMELNYWSRTKAKRATYDEAKKEWTVVVEARRPARDYAASSPNTWFFALGMCPARQTCLTSREHGDVCGRTTSFLRPFRIPDDCVGRKVVVIGSNNSGTTFAPRSTKPAWT